MNHIRQKPLYVCVTCDTELLPPWNEGSWENMSTWSFEKGVPVLRSILDENGIKGTFFTQATAAKCFPEMVRFMADDGHLIGSHGYNHEILGGKPQKVWTPSPPVFLKTVEVKRELLIKADEILELVTGYKPKAFVAPFDNVNYELLELLDDLEFKVDCSFHNYSLKLNSFPFYPLEGRGLIEIPLTVLPSESNGYKNVLEAFTYDYNYSIKKLDEYIRESEQKNPFTVILLTCHPYEFLEVEIPHPRDVFIVGYEKKRTLDRLVRMLREYGAEFTTPLHLSERFRSGNV